MLREVVFLPGATGAAEFWRPVAALMPSEWETRLLDYRHEFPDAAPWVTGDAADWTPDLAGIATPTCLIWEDNDPISPIAVAATLAWAIPDSSLHIVREGSHMLAREHPNEVAELIIEHLR